MSRNGGVIGVASEAVRVRVSCCFVLLAAPACVEAPAPVASDTAAVTNGWDSEIQRRIGLDVTRIRPDQTAYVANQPLMGFAARFDATGAQLLAGNDALDLSLVGWGREDRAQVAGAVRPELGACVPDELGPDGDCIERLEYAREGMTEWWQSTPGQVKVGWDLDDPPAGAGVIEIDLALHGGIAQPGGDDAEILLVGPTRHFRFAGLRAEDADGQPLAAWMEPTEAGLRVLVDDANARWPISVDPSTFTAAWTGTPTDSGTYYGTSLGVSDVNGDGYPDLLIGGHWTTGKLYIYHGGASGPASTASSTLSGTAYSQFANAVAGIDVNNDGYGDVVVGAQGNGSSTSGYFAVYHGSAAGLSGTASRTVTGATTAYLGCALANAGDVNGDGYDDLLVGAYGVATSTGSAYIYAGSASGIAATATTTLNGAAVSDQFGQAVAAAGDVNGDGYDDVIVGSPGASSTTGAASIFHGSSTGISTTAAVTLAGTGTYAYFGTAVAGGDIDGDGYSDVVVGSVGYSSYVGRADAFYGSTSGVTATGSTTLAGSTGSGLGADIAMGDFNGDGYADAAVGAYSYNSGSGAVWVYSGGASGLSTTVGGSINGASGDYLGVTMAGVGDVNLDGLDDFVAGAPYYSSRLGFASLYYGVSDADGDGYTPGSSSTDDCDDTDAAVHPGATERTGDGVDQNCDGVEKCYDDDDDDGYLDTAGDTRNSTDTDCDDVYEGLSTDPTTDCADTSASRHPGATEVVGDGIDQDCDGYDACYDDDDNDGYLDTSGDTRASTDSDCNDAYEGKSTDPTTDCDDASASIHPGATETTGDDVDVNCDGGEKCYDDDDDDGYLDTTGDTRTSSDTDCADAYEGRSTDGTTDCDDTSATINPGAAEIVGDGIDENCDSRESCYDDDDNDGFLDTAGDTRSSTDTDCLDTYEGRSSDPTTDCDDTNATVNPDAAETVGDGVDYDCDGLEICYDDDDDDGYLDASADTVVSLDTDCSDAAEGTASDPTTDCDDRDAARSPAAAEIAGDEVDQNCDGSETCYDDDDNDGILDSAGDTRASTDKDCADPYEGTTADPTTDCDDADDAAYPGAVEVVADAVDQNCDGADTCYADTDGDGFGDTTVIAGGGLACDGAGESAVATDCDPDDAATWPGADEVPGDGIDEDCDGSETCYVDGDGDGEGGASALTTTANLECDGAGQSSVATDCDDADPAVHATAMETPADGADTDCDGMESCFADADGDGFGDPATLVPSADLDCTTPGVAAVDTDCDDSDGDVNPDGDEAPADAVDQDCDGVEWCYIDDDLDGHGVSNTDNSTDIACTNLGFSTMPDDCDDAAPTTFPGNEETCNSLDDNCDGNVDEGAADCDTARDRSLCGCQTGTGAVSLSPLVALGILALRRRRIRTAS